VAAVSGDLYLAVVSPRPNRAVTGVSGLGLSWTPVAAQCSARSIASVSVWRAIGTPTGAGAVTATFASSTTAAVISVMRYSGVDAANPIGAVTSRNTLGVGGECTGGSDTAVYSMNLDTGSAQSLAVGAVAIRNRTHTPGAGYTEQYEFRTSTGSDAAAVAGEDQAFASAGPVVVNGTLSSSTDWAGVALELRAGAAAPGCTGDAQCSDGQFCNGVEQCLSGTCTGGAAVDCSDGVACTADSCDEGTDACGHAPNDGLCGDGQFCNGVEFCDAVSGCSAGPDPCPGTTCDEAGDACGCNLDEDCDDGQSCNGLELCSAGSCTPGTPVDCTDGIACTVDACNEASDTCTHDPSHALCSDGLFCNGAEQCDAVLGCLTGTPPCAEECNEAGDSCGGAGPLTFEEQQSGASASSATVATVAPLAAAPGNLYLAAVSMLPLRTVSSVSGLGLVWTQVDAQCGGRGKNGVSLWMAQGTPASAGTVTASFASAPTGAAIAVARYSGVDAVDPIGTVVSFNSLGVDGACTVGVDAASYSGSLVASEAGSLSFGAVAIRNRTHTPGSGYVERAERASGTSGDAAGVAVEERPVASAGAVPVTGSFSGTTDYAVIAVEILP
jgi:hypothetical protein